MLRQFRLKRRAAFAYVYKKGDRTNAKNLLLLSARSREGLKIGLSVSKKVGGAVVRNRVKRLLREALNTFLDGVDGHFMYVIVARPSIVDLTYKEVCEELREAFAKAGKLLC